MWGDRQLDLTEQEERVSASDNVRTVRRLYEAGPSGDDPDRLMFTAPRLVWHVQGDSPVSGGCNGCTGAFEAMPVEAQPCGDWDVRVVEVMGNEDLVVATVY